jgi:hypothetical protein
MGERRPSTAIARALVWSGGVWVGLVAAALLFLVVGSLWKLITGDPEWEGIVMLPVASVFCAAVASPGLLLLALGLLLGRRSPRQD